MKKLIAFILCLAMIFGGTAASFGADKAIGSTIKLTKTSGTVTVEARNGKAKKIKTNMKLLNGYTLETAAKSYAYISLDKSKTIKVDANSEVEIIKSGKKLEVYVKDGQIYFDVSEKLDNDESLKIRTNTMITGIHGTIGVIGGDKLVLLEGKVEVQDLETGEITPVTEGYIYERPVAPAEESDPQEQGQQGTTPAEDPAQQEQPGAQGEDQQGTNPETAPVKLAKVTAAEIPGFASVAIKEDSKAQERISEVVGTEVIQTVVKEAASKLAEDQVKAAEEIKLAEEKAKEAALKAAEEIKAADITALSNRMLVNHELIVNAVLKLDDVGQKYTEVVVSHPYTPAEQAQIEESYYEPYTEPQQDPQPGPQPDPIVTYKAVFYDTDKSTVLTEAAILSGSSVQASAGAILALIVDPDRLDETLATAQWYLSTPTDLYDTTAAVNSNINLYKYVAPVQPTPEPVVTFKAVFYDTDKSTVITEAAILSGSSVKASAEAILIAKGVADAVWKVKSTDAEYDTTSAVTANIELYKYVAPQPPQQTSCKVSLPKDIYSDGSRQAYFVCADVSETNDYYEIATNTDFTFVLHYDNAQASEVVVELYNGNTKLNTQSEGFDQGKVTHTYKLSNVCTDTNITAKVTLNKSDKIVGAMKSLFEDKKHIVTVVAVASEKITFSNTKDFEIFDGQALLIKPTGGDRIFEIASNVTNSGLIDIDCTVEQDQSNQVSRKLEFQVLGDFTNNGNMKFTNHSSSDYPVFKVQNNGRFINNGTLILTGDGSGKSVMYIYGTVTNHGTIDCTNKGNIVKQTGAKYFINQIAALLGITITSD